MVIVVQWMLMDPPCSSLEVTTRLLLSMISSNLNSVRCFSPSLSLNGRLLTPPFKYSKKRRHGRNGGWKEQHHQEHFMDQQSFMVRNCWPLLAEIFRVNITMNSNSVRVILSISLLPHSFSSSDIHYSMLAYCEYGRRGGHGYCVSRSWRGLVASLLLHPRYQNPLYGFRSM